MSKKTKAIYENLVNLDAISQKLESLDDDMAFEMKQNLKSLRFWIDSLYSYNGKSTSRAKKIASRENGKKGGRPPKAVTVARRKIAELEEVIIPDLQSKIRLSVSAEDEAFFKKQLEEAEKELSENKKIVP